MSMGSGAVVATSAPSLSVRRRFSEASTGQSMIVSLFELSAVRSAGASSPADSMRQPIAPKLSAYFTKSSAAFTAAFNSRGFSAPVNAWLTRAPERYQQQPSHNRKVLQEVNHLHSLLRTREGPKVVEDERDGNQVGHQCPGPQARFESEQNRQSSSEFKKNGRGQEEWNGDHPFRSHITGRARPVTNFSKAAQDENQAQQNSPEQREAGFNFEVHVCSFLIQFVADHFIFESNSTNTSW